MYRLELSRCPEVTRALEGIKYIAAITQSEEESNKVGIIFFTRQFNVCI